MEELNDNTNIEKTKVNKEDWIAVRRNSLYDYFNLPEKNKAEAEAVFDKMRALAADCPDQGVFETRLLQSPVNREYMDLFTKNSRHVRMGAGMGGGKSSFFGSLAGNVAGNSAVNIGKQQLRNRARGFLVNALPDELSDWLIYKWYNIPILSEIKSFFNLKDTLRRWFGKKPYVSVKERQVAEAEKTTEAQDPGQESNIQK